MFVWSAGRIILRWPPTPVTWPMTLSMWPLTSGRFHVSLWSVLFDGLFTLLWQVQCVTEPRGGVKARRGWGCPGHNIVRSKVYHPSVYSTSKHTFSKDVIFHIHFNRRHFTTVPFFDKFQSTLQQNWSVLSVQVKYIFYVSTFYN